MTTTPVVTVGVDGSQSALAAGDWAVDYARSHDASRRLVNGLEMPELMLAYTRYPLRDVRDGWDRLHQEATNGLEATLATWRTKYPTVQVGTLVIRDRPAGALLEQGATAQLLVVGSHGRGGFPGMRLGSGARRLVHHADCPVLVVRHAVAA